MTMRCCHTARQMRLSTSRAVPHAVGGSAGARRRRVLTGYHRAPSSPQTAGSHAHADPARRIQWCTWEACRSGYRRGICATTGGVPERVRVWAWDGLRRTSLPLPAKLSMCCPAERACPKPINRGLPGQRKHQDLLTTQRNSPHPVPKSWQHATSAQESFRMAAVARQSASVSVPWNASFVLVPPP